MSSNKPRTIGTPLNKLKDLPKSIITHKPFVIFRPYLQKHEGQQYAIMDYLYFYKNLMVSSPYKNGQYFDEMPAGDQLSFEAVAFNKKVKRMVVSNTYYFNVNLQSSKLLFKMNAAEGVIEKYNKANPKNPIGHQGFINPDTGLPMFFTEDCEIVIPPPPPTM